MSIHHEREESVRRHTSSPVNSRAPFFEQLPNGGLIIEGTNGNFECRVKGYPVPVITWTRNQLPLSIDSR